MNPCNFFMFFFDKLIYMSTTRLTIKGPFYLTTYAEIPQELAKSLISGDYELTQCRGDIEDFDTFRSIYGAEDPCLLVNNEEILDSSEIGELAEESEGIHSDKSVDLNSESPSKYYFICREICEGDEHRDFEGEFDKSRLKVVRTLLCADDEITDIFEINYPNTEIIDETSSEYDGFWVFHNGVLTDLQDT